MIRKILRAIILTKEDKYILKHRRIIEGEKTRVKSLWKLRHIKKEYRTRESVIEKMKEQVDQLSKESKRRVRSLEQKDIEWSSLRNECEKFETRVSELSEARNKIVESMCNFNTFTNTESITKQLEVL